MEEIGAYEAKTHFSKLLKRVSHGESFQITKNGSPVAELVPIKRRDPEKIRKAIEGLKEFQKTHSLGGISIKELINEGRKY